jgi:hypothetical protein
MAMILVFAAEIFFFVVLFWNAERFNRMAGQPRQRGKI